jgi:hypothetical protein
MSDGTRGPGASFARPGTPRGRRPGPSKLLLALPAALALTLVLGVALANAIAPSVTIEPASEVSFASAKAKGEIDPGEKETSYRFEYVSQAKFEASEWAEASQAAFGSLPAGASPVPVETTLNGLHPGTAYHLRLLASNADGEDGAIAPSFETIAVNPPEASTVSVSSVTASAAHFEGTVNSGGTGAGEATGTYRFHCEPSCGGAEAEAPIPNTGADETVSANAIGLSPHTTYHVELIARNAETDADGESVHSSPGEFSTDAVPPALEEAPTLQPTQTSARPSLWINAHNAELTDCHVEYGTTTAYGKEAPCAFLDDHPFLGNFQLASAEISGLEPSTRYHFMFVAANLGGSAESEDQTFTTLATAPPRESCVNEVRREEQHSTFLPDCRAYEMVSPIDKNGGDIDAAGNEATIASADGNGIVYSSRAGFADSGGSGVNGQTQYLARRGAAGWESHSITPRSAPEAFQIFVGSTVVNWFSADLSHGVVWAGDLPGASDDIADGINSYREDTGSGALETLSRSEVKPIANPFAFFEPMRWGVSEDDSHIVVVNETQLTPEAAPGAPNVYEWVNGSYRLAGILPDGSVPSEGSSVRPEYLRDTISPDGSALAFISPPFVSRPSESQLYLRRNGEKTIWVSDPEGSGPVAKPAEVELEAVSADGRHVLFTTTSRLLDEDTNDGPDLYLYTEGPDPAHESNLTLISRSGDVVAGSEETPLVGLSRDATKIYFYVNGGLLMLWDNGRLSTLAATSPAVGNLRGGNSISIISSSPGLSRVSPDGNTLAFFSQSTYGKRYGLTGAVTENHAELYIYDAAENTLSCASCPTDGEPATVDATEMPHASNASPEFRLPGDRPRFLSSDGRRVFFSTAEALVREDTNGVSDAYEYYPETGQVTLLSTGTSPDGAWFGGAGSSGDDAFLFTRQKLIGVDTDTLVDLYDARVEGGFPEPRPAPAPCSEDGCQGQSPAGPAREPTGSASFEGPGNLTAKRHRRRHRHQHRRRHLHRGVARRSALR